MKMANSEIEAAIEVFVQGFSADRSRTFPYVASRVGPLWVMRDAELKNPRDYRGEEWVVHDVAAQEADAIVRQHARPGFAISVMIAHEDPDGPTRTAYKALGYRLLRTEGFFVHRLRRIPSPAGGCFDRTRADSRTGGAVGKDHPQAADPRRFARRQRAIPSVCGSRWRRYRWARTQPSCRGSHMVFEHVCRAVAPASRHWPGFDVENVARRSGFWVEILGAGCNPRRGAALSPDGLRADRNAADICVKEPEDRMRVYSHHADS